MSAIEMKKCGEMVDDTHIQRQRKLLLNRVLSAVYVASIFLN